MSRFKKQKQSKNIPENIFIYESSSKGGCYEYALYLFRALKRYFNNVTIILPIIAISEMPFVSPENRIHILKRDQGTWQSKIYSRINFLYRQFVNPIRFIFFIRNKPAKQHVHTIVLHDPDRDNYPPFKWYSEYCMGILMRVMDIAYYHDYLPDKKYYKREKTRYLSIVHGVYDTYKPDDSLFRTIQKQKGEDLLITVLGNIREEKNYRLIIEALVHIPNVKLLIAGAPANSKIDIDGLKTLARKYEVSEKIIWEIKFLSDEELASCIEASDILLLYYQKQFTSQSGILNLIAPYQKKFVYSDTDSGLGLVCKKYNIGIPCKPDSIDEFVKVLNQTIQTKDLNSYTEQWKKYLKDADWSSLPLTLTGKITNE